MLPAGGTDAGAMQKFVPGGAITGALSIPLRNMHQVIEMANKNDVDACSDLLAASLMAMDSWDWAWGAVNAPAKEEAPIKPTKKKKSK
jgi:endoglucanase